MRESEAALVKRPVDSPGHHSCRAKGILRRIDPVHHGPSGDALWRPDRRISDAGSKTVVDPHGQNDGTVRQADSQTQWPRLLELGTSPRYPGKLLYSRITWFSSSDGFPCACRARSLSRGGQIQKFDSPEIMFSGKSAAA